MASLEVTAPVDLDKSIFQMHKYNISKRWPLTCCWCLSFGFQMCFHFAFSCQVLPYSVAFCVSNYFLVLVSYTAVQVLWLPSLYNLNWLYFAHFMPLFICLICVCSVLIEGLELYSLKCSTCLVTPKFLYIFWSNSNPVWSDIKYRYCHKRI